MARIVYKQGFEGQNKLECIEGIEIDLFNGQKALIYPKYAEKALLESEQLDGWKGPEETEIEALRVNNTFTKTLALLNAGSPAAKWVTQLVLTMIFLSSSIIIGSNGNPVSEKRY